MAATRKNKRSKSSGTRKARKSTVKLVRAVAKQVISAQLEDKYARITRDPAFGTSLPIPAAISDTTQVNLALPSIALNPGSAGRIGDQIRPKRLRLDVVLSMNGDLSGSALEHVRCMVLQDRAIKYAPALFATTTPPGSVGTPLNTLLDLGGTTDAFAGQPSDLHTRINREQYQVISDKTFILSKGVGVNACQGTQMNVGTQQVVRFSVKIPCPKVLRYTDTLTTFPANFAPFFVVGYAKPDGVAQEPCGTKPVMMNYTAHLDYEDA